MPKFPRLVVPGYPHHVTQRGARRQQTFFEEQDYRRYISLVSENRRRNGVQIWAYCLMPNHVHLIAVPEEKHGLANLFGTVHQRYAKRVNAIHNWQGHLWQERFYSVVMDEPHTIAALRYVEQNPVRAGLCARPEDWPWSSVHAHLRNAPDSLVECRVVAELIPDWRSFIEADETDSFVASIRAQTSSGRPSGNDVFINNLERKTGRRIRRFKPGPLPKR